MNKLPLCMRTSFLDDLYLKSDCQAMAWQAWPAPTTALLMGSPELIDNILQLVTNILLSSVHKHVPAKQFLPRLKPAWSQELKCALQGFKKAYRASTAAGRPRAPFNHMRSNYKTAKAAFRALLCKHQKEQRDES